MPKSPSRERPDTNQWDVQYVRACPRLCRSRSRSDGMESPPRYSSSGMHSPGVLSLSIHLCPLVPQFFLHALAHASGVQGRACAVRDLTYTTWSTAALGHGVSFCLSSSLRIRPLSFLGLRVLPGNDQPALDKYMRSWSSLFIVHNFSFSCEVFLIRLLVGVSWYCDVVLSACRNELDRIPRTSLPWDHHPSAGMDIRMVSCVPWRWLVRRS